MATLLKNYAAEDLDCNPHHLASLAQDSLNVLAALLNEAPVCSEIARSLSVVYYPNDNNLHKDLRDDFADIDASLEDSLRGFAALFDEVTQDCEVSRDFVFDLSSIDSQYSELGKQFEKMAMAIDSYLTLHEAYEVDCPQSCAALFLLYLEQICIEVSRHDKKMARANFRQWFNGWIKDPEINRLFNFFSPHTQRFSLDELGPIIMFDSLECLIIVLCLIMAHESRLKSSDISMLDQAIKQQKMPGIEPLIRSGLIWSDSIDQVDPHGFGNIAKLFPVV